MSDSTRNTIIIGSGPAGLTAAIYNARAALSPLLIGGIEHGGQLMTTTVVENFPGFPDGVMGPELMMKWEEQAKKYGAELLYKNVDKVDFSSDPKKVWADGEEFTARSIIIATGSSPRRLDIPGEQEFWGKGVSTCATCDGAFYKDKVVAIIGGGDSAMEEAMFLTRFAKKVYVIHRRDEFRASEIMQKRLLGKDGVEVIWNTTVEEVVGNEKVTGLKLKDIVENTQSELRVDGMFLAIGHIPNTDFLKNQVELDEQGFVEVTDKTNTSVDGVFVAGDVHDHRYQQAITAAGMGCMAALDAEKWLESLEDK